MTKACLVEAIILGGSWLVLKMFLWDHVVFGWLRIWAIAIGQSIGDIKVGDDEEPLSAIADDRDRDCVERS